MDGHIKRGDKSRQTTGKEKSGETNMKRITNKDVNRKTNQETNRQINEPAGKQKQTDDHIGKH